MADSDHDAILLPLLEAEKEKEEACLSEIISTHAEPVIKKVVHYRLGISADRTDTKESWDAEDVIGNAMMRLLSHLSKFTKNPQEHSIRDFRGYTAVVAHHACNQYFRDKFPKRTQLNNKLRYLLNHNPDIASWTIEKRLVCGLSPWKNSLPPARDEKSESTFSKMRERVVQNPDPAELSRLLTRVFQTIKHPMFFDDLITLMIDLLGIREQRQAEVPKGETENILDQLENQRVNTAAKIEHHLSLKRLWSEMIALPLRQRTALLLSMRDRGGGSVLYLFPVTGVTSIFEIAKSLTIPPEDFADLWSKLPLEDNSIAARLGVTRQQVINLRRTARERLARRMKHQ